MGNICCGSGKESSKAGAFTVAGGSSNDSRSEIDGGNNKWDAGDASFGGALAGGGGGGGAATPGSSALAAAANNNGSDPLSMMDQQQQLHQQSHIEENTSTSSSVMAAATSANAAAALLLRQEQARLEMIVQAAGRGMVAVRSTRGSNAYYDQGFAAALGQHLEQTTTFPQHVVSRQLPPFESGSGNSSSMTTIAAASSAGDATSKTTSSSTSSATSSSSSVYARLNQPAWEYIQLGIKKHGLAGCAGENPQAYFDHLAESFLDEIVPHKQRLFASNTVHPIVESLL